VYHHCSFGRQSVIMMFHKLCNTTVRTAVCHHYVLQTVYRHCSFVRSEVCYHDVLQTVYRHRSFGRHSVIVLFYKLCTTTVLSVGSLSSRCSTNCVTPLFGRQFVIMMYYKLCTASVPSFGRKSVIMMFYKLCTATIRSVGSLSS